jgi:superfamily II DNA or RNA helicase
VQFNFFLEKDLKLAQKWLDADLKIEIDFSQGAYQASCIDPKDKTRYFPFLQMNDKGDLLDGLCSCASDQKSCPHLAAAYLKIMGNSSSPLHVRFRLSLWNQLCLIAFARHGSDFKVKKSGSSYKLFSPTKKLLFSITPKTAAFKKELIPLLLARPKETEETSLKFSNLSQEELVKWKQGCPSPELQYELSFWADLAKKMMSMDFYEVDFDGEGLPSFATFSFKPFEVFFYIAEVNWPLLIPSLDSVNTQLKVFEFQNYALKELFYDEKTGMFLVTKEVFSHPAPDIDSEKKRIVGDWIFVPGKGFFPRQLDQVFDRDIRAEKVGFVLNHYSAIVQKYLRNIEVHLQPVDAHYEISFDEKHELYIRCYVFEKGDLQKEGARTFGSWVYLPQKGFYRLEKMLFDAFEKVVPFAKMNEFINRHRAWLGGFEGFQTHIYQLESQMQFSVTEQGLSFHSVIEMVDAHQESIDFGEWVYVSGKGFFSKRMGKGLHGIRSGTIIPKEKICAFIDIHKEELELLSFFFAQKSPVKKTQIDVILNEEDRIVVRPHFEWYPQYRKEPPLIFGHYTYVPSEGFASFTLDFPASYCEEKVIPFDQEPYFVFYELEHLSASIAFLEPRLKKPEHLCLKVKKAEKEQTEEGLSWCVEALFESAVGTVDLLTVWKALQEDKKYLFSSAGCLFLNTPRFNWLKAITKRQWQAEQLRLSTLEWFRLSAFEDVKEHDLLLEPFGLNLNGFKSDLRAYQEIGVRWLFSLFMQGLSGFLCDEMGLGKTHQAMGLICAVLNKTQGKVLIVCPTSVLYHWEALLHRFLPHFSVLVFYGSTRSLDADCSILLTSYGTLRSEIAALSERHFDLAVFDELQVAKNSASQTNKALRKIKAKMRLGLTGTPLENRLLELKALFDLIIPTYFPGETAFRELFITPIEKYQDIEKKGVLARLIKPFVLRRKKSEVLLELPEKIEEISYCLLSEEQETLYREVSSAGRDKLIQELQDEEKPVPYLHVFSLLSQLKRICDHPCLINKDFINYRKYSSGKWDLFVELLQEIRDSGQKVVIFSQYLEMLNIMQMYLDQEKIGYASVRGATRDRKEQLERFKEDPECEVFLASLQAVGVGVDLVSASVVIHYDRWWNPAKENQATDRVHRMGQNRGVQVFKMVTKGTIEEHIHSLIERKKSLMEGIIGFDEHDQIKGFTREELLAILKQLS